MKYWIVVFSTWFIAAIFLLLSAYTLFIFEATQGAFTAWIYFEHALISALAIGSLGGLYKRNGFTYLSAIAMLTAAFLLQMKELSIWAVLGCHFELWACVTKPHSNTVSSAYFTVGLSFFMLFLAVTFIKSQTIRRWYKQEC